MWLCQPHPYRPAPCCNHAVALYTYSVRAGCSLCALRIQGLGFGKDVLAHLPRCGLMVLGMRVAAIPVVAAVVIILLAVLPRFPRQMLPAAQWFTFCWRCKPNLENNNITHDRRKHREH